MGIVYFDKHKLSKKDNRVLEGHNINKSLQIYCDFFERLDPNEFELYEGLFHYRVKYSNPVEDVAGVDKIRKIFTEIIGQCKAARLHIIDTAVSGQHAMVYWRFYPHKHDPKSIVGMTRIKFNGYGRVISHTDVWDRSQANYHKNKNWLRRWFGWLMPWTTRTGGRSWFHVKPPY